MFDDGWKLQYHIRIPKSMMNVELFVENGLFFKKYMKSNDLDHN